jgi:hypothetical protein
MPRTLFQNFIDPEQWDAARWLGTAFLHDSEGEQAPFMGIVFENIDAGRKLFEHWIERLGARDRYEELRIAIIEGDILGDDAGYSVHISSNPLHTERRLRADGADFERDQAILVSRCKRMTPAPDSTHLSQFKADVNKHKRYSLIPVSASVEPVFDCAIEKNEIHFKQVSEITESDVDAVVLPVNSFDNRSIH